MHTCAVYSNLVQSQCSVPGHIYICILAFVCISNLLKSRWGFPNPDSMAYTLTSMMHLGGPTENICNTGNYQKDRKGYCKSS